ncbi:MAG: sialate O-acetylesterase [Caulobacteraceae bacterium]|nr:MAG: sialate O-acetylesterase [Caulobacteraceae bacterium]
MFQDHAVLQRGRPIPIWGMAVAGAEVSVSLAGARMQTRAGPDGRWRVNLPAPAPGGPYQLEAHSEGQAQRLMDVLVGDVWLCSGQSNMEMAVRQVANADSELAGAGDDGLRLLLVGRSSQPAFPTGAGPVGRWQVSAPDSAREFSAACFFMGKRLRQSQAVPVGLIATSWGGSVIEDWMSEAALRRDGRYDVPLTALAAYARSPDEGRAQWNQVTSDWWARNDPGSRASLPWFSPKLDDRDWPTIPPSGFWEGTVPELASFDGAVWLRTGVNLTAAQARQEATLEFGPVDDVDRTYVNGRWVGGHEGWNTPRLYPLPAGVLKAGRNVIAIGALDTGGGGGAWGPADQKRLRFADGTSVPLDQPWRYRVSAPLQDLANIPRTPWIGGSGVTTLYNGMIAPLGPYGLAGAAWYQGEANVGDPPGYARLLKALIDDWRGRFERPDLPFLVVQLAGFGPRQSDPVRSLWAETREAQRRVVAADPQAGLAVAIDIGDPYDIHPTNKQEVGRRLALAAERVAYGKAAPSSPEPLRAWVEAGAVRVDYAAAAGLAVYGSDRVVGLQLCDAQDACRWTDGRLEGTALRLPFTGPSPKTVRYCWGDSPVCNLFGAAGLPATPFELAVSLAH